jgi:hypothetical protein
MPKFLKFNHSTKIITINNTKFIPHKLHQLPKDYEEIPMSEQFSHKGFCYINSGMLNWNANKEARLTSNIAIGGIQSR